MVRPCKIPSWNGRSRDPFFRRSEAHEIATELSAAERDDLASRRETNADLEALVSRECIKPLAVSAPALPYLKSRTGIECVASGNQRVFQRLFGSC